MNGEIKVKGVYKHFKGDCYIIEDIATCSETMGKMVVFRSLYDDGELFVRPLESFLEPIDRTKYPNVTQQQRFELMDIKTVRQ